MGKTYFVVGEDCLINDVSDEETREASWIENLSFLRREMNPILRAKGLNEIISRSPGGLRSMARRWNIPASTLSEWLRVLELNPQMQDVVARGLMMARGNRCLEVELLSGIFVLGKTTYK